MFYIKNTIIITIIAKNFQKLDVVISIMTVGIILGFILKSKKKLVRLNDKLVTYAIYLLLFMLGISIGSNEQIMNSLSSLGLIALIVTIGGVLGSIVLGFITYRLFFKKR
ncbi:MAG: hypothetical protein PWR03_1258 [Tenuifilum sp.]|nr:hypothetical protein [Tenuifilum sp.]